MKAPVHYEAPVISLHATESEIPENAISTFWSQIDNVNKTIWILLGNLNFRTFASDPSRRDSTEELRAVANTNEF